MLCQTAEQSILLPDLYRAMRRQRFGIAPRLTFTWTSGSVLGHLAVQPHGDGLRLETLWVDPSARGRGVGSAMIKAFCRACDCLSVSCVLAVSPIGDGGLSLGLLHRFYLKAGFVSARPGNPARHDLMHRLPLGRQRPNTERVP